MTSMIPSTIKAVGVSTSLWNLWCRSYGRRLIKPEAIREPNVSRSGRRFPTAADNEPLFKEIDPDVIEAIRNFETLEPDVSKFGHLLPEHEREMKGRKHSIAKWRIAKKHFKEFFQPEISLLTYAEKEQIRYLYNSDPEEWNLEALAMAFPISVHGLKLLLKSPFRCRTEADIQQHDNRVAENLEKIKTGQIEITPELEKKMEIRKSIPLKLGATSIPEVGLLVSERKPKKLGVFARLVSPHASIDDREDSVEPHPEEDISFNRSQRESKTEKTFSRGTDNSEQKLNATHQESRVLAGMKAGRMTLSEFEGEIRKVQNSVVFSDLPESEQRKFDYLLNVTKTKPTGTTVSTLEILDSENSAPTTRSYIESSRIQRYPVPENPSVELKVEKGQAYAYQTETGYQKPFASEKGRIKLPSNAKREGSVYKVGDSYYNEFGEFLYRPV